MKTKMRKPEQMAISHRTNRGSAYADSVLTAIQAPSGYVLTDHDLFVITAGTGHGINTFTAWCIDKQYVKLEGYVNYTIDCVDAAGNTIKTFTDSAKSGSMRPTTISRYTSRVFIPQKILYFSGRPQPQPYPGSGIPGLVCRTRG